MHLLRWALCATSVSTALATDLLQSGREVDVKLSEVRHNPQDDRRMHHRYIAVTEDGMHQYVDMEGRLRDSTQNVADCVCVFASGNGTGTITVPDDSAAQVRSAYEKEDKMLIMADCGDNKTIIGKPLSLLDDGQTWAVDTMFHSTRDMLISTFEWTKYQAVSSRVPMEETASLSFIAKQGANPAKRHDQLTYEYQWPNRTDTAPARQLATSSAALDWNCDTVSTDSSNPGCADYTDESIQLAYKAGSYYEASVSCEDCSATVEDAGLYASVEMSSNLFRRRWSIDYEFGGYIDNAVLDLGVLVDVQASQDFSDDVNEALTDTWDLVDTYLPSVSTSFTAFGIDFTAGIRLDISSDVELWVDGAFKYEAGAKLIIDGTYSYSGSIGSSGTEWDGASNDMDIQLLWRDSDTLLDAAATLELNTAVELQFGLFEDVATGAGAELAVTLGAPVTVKAVMQANSDGVFSEIDDSFCDADLTNGLTFFQGDCSEPNNFQAQLSMAVGDLYGSFKSSSGDDGFTMCWWIFCWTFTDSEDFTFDPQVPGIGPLSIIYCDCLLDDYVDCSANAGGVCSQQSDECINTMVTFFGGAESGQSTRNCDDFTYGI